MKRTILLAQFILITIGSFAQTKGPTITSQPPVSQTICNGKIATIPIKASGAAPLTYQWFSNPRSGCEFCDTQLVNGLEYSGVTTPTLSINTNYGGDGTFYYCLVKNKAGSTSTNDGSITLSYIQATIGAQGASSCVPASLTLTAAFGKGSYYNWYDGNQVLLPNETARTLVTPVLSVTTNYYVAITNGLCESARTLVTAQINTVPPPTASGSGICGPGTVTLSATGGSAGQYRWYDASGKPDAKQTNGTYTTPSLTVTTTYHVSINDGTCESTQVPVTATINGVPKNPGATGGSACGSGAVTLTATGGSAGQFRWYSAAGVAISGQTNSTYTTPALSATTNYLVSVNNGTCESTNTPVAAIINPLPATPGASATSSCGSGAITLTASGAPSGQYRWYTAAGVIIAGQTATTYVTPVLSATTTYLVSINNGTCEGNKASVSAVINTVPAAPGATGNSSCGPAAITLNATNGTAGQYRWYTAAGILIAGQTNSAYTTPVLSASTGYLVSINNGTCEGAKTAVTAVINAIPAAPGATGNAACGSGAITLNASGGAAGQYRWYTSAGVLIAGQSNSAYTTPVLSTTTSYSVSLNNGSCEGAKTPVNATINAVPATPGASGNSACGPSAITLNASGGAAGQYRWYTASGVAIPGQTGSTYTSPVLSSTTSFLVSINNGTCEGAKSSANAVINTVPGVPGAAGNYSCGPAAIVLSASGGSDGQYRWYAGGVLINGQTNSSYTTPVLSTTTTFSVSINNGTCESAQAFATATVNSIPSAPFAAGASSCVAASLTLNASGAANGQYRWYNVDGSIISGQVNSSFITPVLNAPTQYYVAINNGICESTKTSVVGQINSASSSPLATGGSSCGPGSVTLTAAGAADGQFRWYSDATTPTPIAAATNAAFVTPVISATTTYYVSINNGSCESGRSSVVATINPIPSAPTAAPVSTCTGLTALIKATGGTDGQYRWYTVSSGGTALAGETNGNYTTPDLPVTTTYFVSVNNGTCESARTSVTATVAPCKNDPPVISTQNSLTVPGGSVTIDLHAHISDPDGNLDYTTLTVIKQPKSGAKTSLDSNGNLTLDYSGLPFAGRDELTIQICDLDKACTQQVFTVDVEGNIIVYQGVSPNNDGMNDLWIIGNIDALADTKLNKVSIFDRWGDSVFEIDNYDNVTRVFKGFNKSGNELSPGVYFYKIQYPSGRKSDSGYLSLKR